MAKWINASSYRVARVARYSDETYPRVEVVKRTDKAALLRRVGSTASAWVPLWTMAILATENACGVCRVTFAAWIRGKLVFASVNDAVQAAKATPHLH